MSLGAGNTVSKYKWGYKLKNLPVAVPLDPFEMYESMGPYVAKCVFAT